MSMLPGQSQVVIAGLVVTVLRTAEHCAEIQEWSETPLIQQVARKTERCAGSIVPFGRGKRLLDAGSRRKDRTLLHELFI